MPYGMGTLKIPLRSIRCKEGLHYCLGAKHEEAVKDKQQSTYSQVWISFGDSILGLYVGHVWPSGWVVRKVANGPGFEPSAKGGVSREKGLSLSFAFVRT